MSTTTEQTGQKSSTNQATRLDAELFHHDPTRTLEEVQKVNDVEKAKNDVQEFYETDSASAVLEALGDLIAAPSHPERFLYLHATFGSGKTHLLKLIGYATGQSNAPNAAEIARQLGDRFPGFKQLRDAFGEADVDRFIPVFLNLLDRDASSEPPVPLLLYKALGNKLGYQIDPPWLLEFAFQLDVEYGLWQEVKDYVLDTNGPYSGAFFEVYEKRGMIRGWLARVVSKLASESDDSDLRKRFPSERRVLRAIQSAERAVTPEEFTAEELAERIQQAKSYFEERDGESTQFLFGLDEVALFIGDERTRYTEFRRTIKTLADEGVQPVVIGTGQWSLMSIHKEFVGQPDSDAWYANEVELKGTDTEIIVRKRWLRKSPDHWEAVKAALESSSGNILTSDERSLVGDRDSTAVESYPFRPHDLRHIREVLQHLMSRGRTTRHEYVQGRALLVLVRALFTEHGWSKRELGALVPWSEIFELLDEETPFIPSWVGTLLEKIEVTVGDASERAVDVARVIYLLNRIDDVDATIDNIVRLLADDLESDLDELREEVEKALHILVEDKRYVRPDGPTENGDSDEQVYRLLTEDEVTLAEKIEERAAGIQLSQLRNWIGEVVQNDDFLASEGLRREEKIGGEREVPIRFYYTVLRELAEPNDRDDAVAVRVLVTDEPEPIRKTWVEHQQNRPHGNEDILLGVELPVGFEDRLRRQLATQSVLDNSSHGHTGLRDANLEERRYLRQELGRALQQADIYDRTGKKIGSYAESFAPYVVELLPEKFPHRHTLETPLQIGGDAPRFEKFFQSSDGNGATDWPLSDRDAKMLGVDTFNREISGGWAGEFMEVYNSHNVPGSQLLDDIQSRDGRWLGTSLEALQALLLTLACGRKVQLRQGGKTIREPKRMAVALKGKSNLESLTVKLEPPVDASELQRLQQVFTALLEKEDAPDEPDEIVQAIANWARDCGGRLIEFRDACLNSTFDDEKVGFDISALRELIEPVFRAEPNAELNRDDLVEEEVVRAAKAYRQVRPLLVGDQRDLWDRFVSRAEQLRDEYRTHELTVQFARFESGQSIPSAEKVESLLRRSEKIGEESEEDAEGEEDAGATGTEQDKDESDDSEKKSTGKENGDEDTDQKSEEELIDDVVNQLSELPEGTAVVVENKK